jgi:lipoate-protein ligase B
MIRYKFLGKNLNYAQINALQEHLVNNNYSNIILLQEFKPVYTTGRRSKLDVKLKERLEKLGAQYQTTMRGGQITFHGPGQLVGYPIIDLKKFSLGVREYVCLLEKTLIETCDYFGVKTNTTTDTGIWVGNSKIAAIGIQVQKHITSHGFALNCNTNLDWFNHIVPCGLEGKGVTSLTKESNRNISIEETIDPFLKAFGTAFKVDILPVKESSEIDHEISKIIKL